MQKSKNIWIGVALMVGIIIGLIIILMAKGGSTEDSQQTDGEYSGLEVDQQEDSQQTDGEYSGLEVDCSAEYVVNNNGKCSDGSRPTYDDYLENLQGDMRDSNLSPGEKEIRLRNFVVDNDLQPVSCGDLPPLVQPAPLVQLGDSDVNVNVALNWEAIQNASQNASGDLRAFYEALLDAYDDVDAVAMLEEINAGILTTAGRSEDYDQIISRVFREYGLDPEDVLTKTVEAVLRYKVTINDGQACAYDIDYSIN